MTYAKLIQTILTLPHQLPLILRAFANPPPADLAALDLAAMLSGSGAAAGAAAGSTEAGAAGATGSSGATASLDAALPDHIRELGYQVRNMNMMHCISISSLEWTQI